MLQLVYVLKSGPVSSSSSDCATHPTSAPLLPAATAVGVSVVTPVLDSAPVPEASPTPTTLPGGPSDAAPTAAPGEATAATAATVAEVVAAADRDLPITAAVPIAVAISTEGAVPDANNSAQPSMAADAGAPAVELMPVVRRAAHFPEVCDRWICPRDHNHLRMTRIIKSLHLFGLRDEARAFFSALQAVVQDWPRAINRDTIQFWREASLYDP